MNKTTDFFTCASSLDSGHQAYKPFKNILVIRCRSFNIIQFRTRVPTSQNNHNHINRFKNTWKISLNSDISIHLADWHVGKDYYHLDSPLNSNHKHHRYRKKGVNQYSRENRKHKVLLFIKTKLPQWRPKWPPLQHIKAIHFDSIEQTEV